MPILSNFLRKMRSRRENTFKKYLMRKMGTSWDAQSHEDKYSLGIPDLSFGARGVNGWIELKQIPTWPKLEHGLAKPDKYTSIQLNWLRNRNKKGGHCFVMVKVGKDEIFLFDSDYAGMVKYGMTRGDYNKNCLWSWSRQRPFSSRQLLVAITDKDINERANNIGSADGPARDLP